jgi:hypothetical protein
MTRSYYAEYWALGTSVLLGGVKRSRTSRFASIEDATDRLAIALGTNQGASRACTGEVRGSEQPPEIFRHCAGHPAQAIGGKCFGCGKVLTEKDAREHGKPSKPKAKKKVGQDRELSQIQAIKRQTIKRLQRLLLPYLWTSSYHDQGGSSLRVFVFAEAKHRDHEGRLIVDGNRAIPGTISTQLHCLQGFYHAGTIDATGGGCAVYPFTDYPTEDLCRLEEWLIRFLGSEAQRSLTARSQGSKA